MEEGEASSPAPQLRASFTALSEYSACPLRYRYLHVEHRDEPAVEPDWRAAPREPALGVASTSARNFGRAVPAALKTWQGDVDSGLAPVPADLEARISDVAQREGLDHAQLQRALVALHKGLDAYVRGPWPRCRTIALEHSAQHRLSERGFTLELALRVDRIAETDGRVAIIDFKTVPPHAMQLRADIWQLRTYALAAPELLGVATRRLSWNTGFSLRREPFRDADPVGVVRPGQRLQVLAADSGHLKVRQDAEGLEGWIPAHIVAPWPQG